MYHHRLGPPEADDAEHQRAADPDHHAAGDLRQGERFVEQQRADGHGDAGDAEFHADGAGGADGGDQLVEDHIGDGAHQHAGDEQRGDIQQPRHARQRHEGDQRQDEHAAEEERADGDLP